MELEWFARFVTNLARITFNDEGWGPKVFGVGLRRAPAQETREQEGEQE
jgi:hypothetical protein